MANEKDMSIEKTTADKAAESKKLAKSDKSGKPDKDKKFTGRVKKFFRDLRGEFKKIIWPTFQTVVRNTGVTLAMCAVLGLAICLFDFGLDSLIRVLLRIKMG